jgi:hypothetical protein
MKYLNIHKTWASNRVADVIMHSLMQRLGPKAASKATRMEQPCLVAQG